MMKIEDPSDPTQEIEVYTQAELAEQVAAKDAEIQTARDEAEKYKKVSAEKTENFKHLNEMTETERASLSADKLESLKRAEAAEAKVTALEEKYNGDVQARIASDREKALAKYHGNNPELKKAIEENYALIAMEGTDTETINRRAEKAAAMYSGSVGRQNPLMMGFGGSAPSSKDASRTEAFLESDKGKKGMDMMK